MCRVNAPNSVSYLDRSPVFEWCVVMCGSKNGNQKDMYLKEFGLHAQNLFNHSRLNSQHNSGGLLSRFMALVLFDFEKSYQQKGRAENSIDCC